MSIIAVNGLTKYYGKARGIVDVSFNVDEGEIFGFIGPNGAGKSTTIRLLLSLIHPSGGRATVFGKDVVTHGPEIRRDIGYLPSEVYYYEGMTMKEIGATLDLSESRVSQMHSSILARLKAQMQNRSPELEPIE